MLAALTVRFQLSLRLHVSVLWPRLQAEVESTTICSVQNMLAAGGNTVTLDQHARLGGEALGCFANRQNRLQRT